MAKTRRSYKGAAASTTTSTSISASGTTNFTIAGYTGWPYGSDPFFVVVEPGTANEEKILVTRTGSTDTTINVYSSPSVAANRGADGTSAVAHASGSTVYPVFTAVDADEANELASKWSAKGDLVSHGTTTFEKLAVGTNDYLLTADSSAASGLKWAQVVTAGIANDAVTAAKIATGAVGSDELASDSVTAAKIAAGAVGESELASDAVTAAKIAAGAVGSSELATAIQNLLVPAGTVVATVSSTADTGWLLLNGQTVSGAESAYPALWAVAPASWKSSSSLVLPNAANRGVFGQGTTALGATGGSNTVTIASGNLPTHTHSIDHDHASASVSITDPGHTHNGNANRAFVVQTLNSAGGSVSTSAGPHTADNATTTASATTGITASVDLPNFTGSSGNGGFANSALTVTNAHLALNFQIKAH